MAAFPTLSNDYKPDSAQFTEVKDDPALRKEMEGGYIVTRPRHTRAPRKTWQVAYQQLDNADKLLLDNHFDTQRGGSLIFTWVNPQSLVSFSVRYKSPITWRYVGAGDHQVWDCSFELEQA